MPALWGVTSEQALSPGDAGEASDAALASACHLLTTSAQPSLPFEYVEALAALGRPEVALAVYRVQAGGGHGCGGGSSSGGSGSGGSGSGGGGHRSLEREQTLLNLRLKCGLLHEAFFEVRRHCAGIHSAELKSRHTTHLLTFIANWDLQNLNSSQASARDGGAAAGATGVEEPQWVTRLLQLPLDQSEEDVLVGWLSDQMDDGSAVGDHLPLFFLARNRIPEALGAWKRWSQVQQDLAVSGVGRPLSPLTPAISALIQASSRLLPPTLRNISVAAANGGDGGALVQGPLRVVQGLSQVADPGGAPVVECGFHGPEPPPFVSSLRHWEQPLTATAGSGFNKIGPVPNTDIGGQHAGEGLMFRLFPSLGMEGSGAAAVARGGGRSAVKRPRQTQGYPWM
ncbi:MAG: hypothetical protein WDW38_011387 [Sanguina aurantia]